MGVRKTRYHVWYDLVVWFVLLSCVFVYRHRSQINAWVAKFWVAMERQLCQKMASALAKEFQVVVLIRQLNLHRGGIVLEQLRLGDETVVAYMDRVEFRTETLTNLASLCLGAHWVGSPRLPFCVGFVAREVDSVVLTGVRVEVMDQSWTIEAESQKNIFMKGSSKQRVQKRSKAAAHRPGALSSMLKTAEQAKKHSLAASAPKIKRRTDYANEFLSRFDPVLPEDRKEYLAIAAQPNPSATWRIGIFEIVDMTVDMYGNQLHLRTCSQKGLVGSTKQIQRRLGIAAMQEMIGPKHTFKQVKRGFFNQFSQIRSDVRHLYCDARNDLRETDLKNNLASTLYKNPFHKRRRVEANALKPEPVARAESSTNGSDQRDSEEPRRSSSSSSLTWARRTTSRDDAPPVERQTSLAKAGGNVGGGS